MDLSALMPSFPALVGFSCLVLAPTRPRCGSVQLSSLQEFLYPTPPGTRSSSLSSTSKLGVHPGAQTAAPYH